MAIDIQLLVTGDKQVDMALRKFEAKAQKKMIRRATRDVVKQVVLPDAKRMVPHDTGQLERSLKVRAVTRRRNTIGHGVVTGKGLFQGDQFYGAFVELGTRKMQADAYLRPALWANSRAVLAHVIRFLSSEIRAFRGK